MTGYPDFFGYSIFEQYGVYRIDDGNGIVVHHPETMTIANIPGKGKLVSGYIYVTKNNSSDAFGFYIYVDSYLAYNCSFAYFIDYSLHDDDTQVMNCYYRDRQINRIGMNIKKELTYSKSLIVKVYNSTGSDLTYSFSLTYAAVTL